MPKFCQRTSMIVAFHPAPREFLKSDPPYATDELLSLVQKVACLGFKCFQLDPIRDFVEINCKRLKTVLDRYGMKINIHVGGLYDAEKFAMSEDEYERAQREIRFGIELSKEISSPLVSFHPPFFAPKSHRDNALLSKARSRFIKLVEEESKFACNRGIKMALESFCYPPFIFDNMRDFKQFISHFHSTGLGVLLEAGHLYQARFNLDDAIQTFRESLMDVHVHDATLGEDFKKATHLPIGKGSIDFHHVIGKLREAKYDGWLTLEIHGNEGEIAESKQILESLIGTVA